MPDIQLYNLVIPGDSQTGASGSAARNIQSGSIPGEDVAAVQSVAVEPEDRSITGQFRARFADEMAAEIKELFNAASFGAVPFTHVDTAHRPEHGYYTLRDVTVEPIEARADGLYRIDGDLVRQGTATSHYRAVRTNPGSIDNPFGGNPGEIIAIPEMARDVMWIDERGGQRKDAGPVARREGEYCTHVLYDSQYPPWTKPTLVYKIDYHQEPRGDCRVWDDHNREKVLYEEPPGDGSSVGDAIVGSATVGSGRRVRVASTWQRVFRTDHDFDGRIIVESGSLRLIPDEVNGKLRAFRWNSMTSHWDLLQLGMSPWRLKTFNLSRIGPERVEAMVDFRNQETNDLYRLDMMLRRGLGLAQWTKPNNASPTPDGLVDRLAPIARPSGRDSREVQTLIRDSNIPA
ncbi:hypothetical protein ACFFQF_00945 [Haladaptatus pallidirubidus]|uniref:Uncharacterized protein n=1 Tax=Haladaptatus pallidirubidus TaxID=1008152 RepID=A0AAV3UC08_9EURY|nr:hypothetical protein [Haladaptatus pallidirubidus]